MRIRSLLSIFLLAVLSACAAMGKPIEPRQPGNANELTGEEIRASNYLNLYDAVEALRPLWLQTRSRGTTRQPAEVQVYLDNLHQGNTETLRRMSVTGIKELRYLDATSARIRYPRVQLAGVIVVVSGQPER
jgi:hypothetical protein